MTDQKIALVLGATGSIGAQFAQVLAARGWIVRALHRDPNKLAKAPAGIDWIKGDAMDRDAVIAAATGAALIVHGVNPLGYRNWAGLAVPMLENTIAAAKATNARIFFPGTVYNFGPDAFPLLAEDSPQRPLTRKGKIRVQMERHLRAASAEGVPVLILRAGDWFGPSVTGNSWFRAALVKPGKPLRSVVYPGHPEAGHAWAYVPDYVETAIRLVERGPELDQFAVFHFDGHWFDPGIGIADTVRLVSGNPKLPIRKFPWWLVFIGAPFAETLREMIEMRYLWNVPVRLDNRRLLALLGEETHTAAPEAVRASLQGLGCLGAAPPRHENIPDHFAA